MLAFVSCSSRLALRSRPTQHTIGIYHSLFCGPNILRVTSVFSSRLFQVLVCTMAGQSGSGTTFKYFSYGSNLLRERILINNPSAKFYGVATLHGYKLTFDAAASVPVSEWLDDNWCGAAATIRPASTTDRVCGVVWDVDLAQIEFLDKQECLYTPLEVDVIGERGETLTCRTYEMERKTHGIHLPSPHYKQVIVAGAKQNGLPPDYIRFLEGCPDNGTTTTPPIYAKVVEMVKKFREENGKNFLGGTANHVDLDLGICRHSNGTNSEQS